MGVFRCEKCGCIENTALGMYWAAKGMHYKDSSLDGKKLCSACTPTEYANGTPTGFNGEWHGHFPRKW